MPYNPMYPQGYPQYQTYPTYPQPTPTYPQYPQSMAVQPTQTVTAPTVQQPQTPIQDGGFIQVPGEDVARNWPVAPGNCVKFIDQSATHVYTKTASYNQFEAPQFVSFRLVREESTATETTDGGEIPYALKEDLVSLAGAVQGVNDSVTAINNTVATMKSDIEKMNGDLYGLAGKKATDANVDKE